MVFKYAKSAVGTVKDGLGSVKSRIGWGSSEQDPYGYEDIEGSTKNIGEYESKINEELSNIDGSFNNERNRSMQKLREIEQKDFSLDSISVNKDVINLEGRDDSFMTGLFDDSISTVEIQSDNLRDYVEELTHHIKARYEDISLNQSELDIVGDETIGELLEEEYDVELSQDNYTAQLIESTRVDGLLNQRAEETKNQIKYLERELADTVDQYTKQIYDEAVDLAEDLGGKNRSNRGEFDILTDLSKSRSSLLEYGSSSRTVKSSGILEESEETLKTQSKLVDRYLEQLGRYRDSIGYLHDQADDVLDQGRLRSVEERLGAINEGIENLGNVVHDEADYDSVDEALNRTVRAGLSRGDVIGG